MQEEVEQRTVTLAINTTKMSANVLKSAIAKYLAYRKEKAREGPVKPCGKQSVKQLVGQNQGVSNIEITDKNIKDFERTLLAFDDNTHQEAANQFGITRSGVTKRVEQLRKIFQKNS